MNIDKIQFNHIAIEEIKRVYENFKKEIEEKLKEFRELGKNGSKMEIFKELAFCLLTPQSRATICWKVVENMINNDTLFNGDAKELLKSLDGVRFKYKKSYYLVSAREKFFNEGNPIYYYIKNNEDPYKLRDYIIKNIKGLGYKEASHFLRNIGLGSELAILDRHILKNLRKLGIIDELTKGFNEKTYKEIEKKIKEFSKDIKIPMDHLDLTLWAKETGEVFK